MLELHAIFKGRVQGVGFRWTILDYAEKFRLIGTVQNLSNGSVEVYAQGEEVTLQAFLNAIQQIPGPAQIHSIQKKYREPCHIFSGFQILH